MNNKSRSFFLFLVATVLIIGLVVFLFLFANKVRQKLPGQGSADDAVLIVVGSVSITEGDLKAYDLIYNAEARYQQSATETAVLASRDEVLASLIRVTKIAILAEREGIEVTVQEIEDEIEKSGGRDVIEANISRYGWSFEDWNGARENSLLETKLGEKVLGWRLAEFVAVRWDVIPQEVEANLIETFKGKSQAVLQNIEDRFVAGEDVEEITNSLRVDPSVLVDFSANAIQFSKVDPDPRIQFMQRVIKPETNQEWQGHALSLESNVESDLWCSEFACYLTRVLDGNNSIFTNLDDYLNAEIK